MSIFEYNLNFPTDFIIIVLVSLITIFSFWKGLIQSILSLLTWVGSILITIYTQFQIAAIQMQIPIQTQIVLDIE